MKRIASPQNITSLEPNQVFVYGANRAGIHGAGAARQALLHYGAVYGKFGLQGQSYGIPTKDEDIKTLRLDQIDDHVYNFLITARAHKDTIFLVTEIGCGLAGYKPKDIAPMFRNATENVRLPQSFIDILNETISP